MKPSQRLKIINEELSPIEPYKIMDSNSEGFVPVLETYSRLMDSFKTVTEAELEFIETTTSSYSAHGGAANSASSNTLTRLHRLLAPDQDKYISYITQIVSSPSQIDTFRGFVKQTAAQMVAAYAQEEKSFGATPIQGTTTYGFRDGDPISDSVRWTYLQINTKIDLGIQALVHYFVAHLFDQIAVSWLANNIETEVLEKHQVDTNKDGALTIFSDLLLIRANIEQPHQEIRKLHNLWLTPRIEGGLGWIHKTKNEYFKAAINN